MSAAVTLPKTPSFRLDGRRALVTGAGRGLGLAMAAALAEAGADVMLLARSGEKLEKAAEAIWERPVGAVVGHLAERAGWASRDLCRGVRATQ